MIRTQIQLPEGQARRLKEIARSEGISLAEIIRRCIDHALPELQGRRATRYRRARRALGRFSSGQRDLAETHDAYLDEVFE